MLSVIAFIYSQGARGHIFCFCWAILVDDETLFFLGVRNEGTYKENHDGKFTSAFSDSTEVALISNHYNLLFIKLTVGGRHLLNQFR